jgi:hypothetical protein
VSKQPVRAHLLDALLSGVVLPPQPARNVVLNEEEMFHHNAALRQILAPATCVEATNVARFFDDSYMADDESGAAFWKDLKCRWIYLTMDFLEFPHKPGDGHISGLRGPYHVGAISVAEDGSLLNFWMSHGSAIDQQESLQVAAASLVGWTTLAMLNCANIGSAVHSPPEAFQKARTQSGKKPLVSYHTVHVDLDKTPRAIGAEGLPGDGSTPRRHKKRGHMKDYRGGKGLFGRYKGVWYWGPSLAGSAEEGVVVSDYEVTP